MQQSPTVTPERKQREEKDPNRAEPAAERGPSPETTESKPLSDAVDRSMDTRTVRLPAAADADFKVPATADSDEVAALVAAVSAHLSRERAAAAQAAAEKPDSTIDLWAMSGRYRRAGRRTVKTPARLRSLDGWKLASRAHTF